MTNSGSKLRPLLAGLVLAGCAGGTLPGGVHASGTAGGKSATAPLIALPTPVAGTARAAKPAAMSADAYQQSLAKAYTEFKGVAEGKNADYIPALAKVDSKLYGLAIATVDGAIYEVGNSRNEFSIQSISKVFTLARAIEALGPAEVEKRVGVNATGQAFNSIIAVEMNKKTTPAMNPLVNPGAIATVDAVPAPNADAKWNLISGTHNSFAGRQLALNQEVYKSESETNTRNRAITTLLQAYEVVKGDASEVLDLYTRQCSINVSARDLAVMGATLANGGKNPLTGEQVVKPETAERVLAVMATAGLYETTGAWMYDVSLPAKSGVGGGIVAVAPGRFAIGSFAPPLDEAGNSVKGQKAIERIAEELGANIYAGGTR
ncbi:MAG TPA: glutaminase A [Polyangiaceae bacterium]|nr:glutaminase A [Polyangiaceae bacterium]